MIVRIGKNNFTKNVNNGSCSDFEFFADLILPHSK
jgi:hypothetical protein